ncbi:MAG: prephenate dehydrogenase/arogenate dehydrogenase family protein, partial [Deltaproteobacteria bacterium]|nr:prephenate dehydrogenase/arogenate dehydrogenase family protein [Deltaproteobacteria bacterium]
MNGSLTLIGGNGRMGLMFRRAWEDVAPIFSVDPRTDRRGTLRLRARDIEERVPQSALVLLCVPAPAVREVMEALAPHLAPGQILADICSVKVQPMRWMEERFPGPVVGTHPMFGPENERKDARVALVRGARATDEHAETLAALFRRMGCKPFATTAEAHDRACATSQSLHFILNAAYFATAAR